MSRMDKGFFTFAYRDGSSFVVFVPYLQFTVPAITVIISGRIGSKG